MGKQPIIQQLSRSVAVVAMWVCLQGSTGGRYVAETSTGRISSIVGTVTIWHRRGTVGIVQLYVRTCFAKFFKL